MSLIEDMGEYNPWWNGTLPDTKDTVERESFGRIYAKMDEKDVLALVGLRRSGKTTMMMQIIEKMIEDGAKAENILYFSFDMPGYGVKKVIETYFKEILMKHPSEERTYIFLDEVQNVPEWSRVVKAYYDRGYPIKFVVSGSSSFNILRGSGESLIGRISIERMHPFSFREFLRYRGVEIHEKGACYDMKLSTEFRRYLKMGSFPESYGKDLREYLSTMVDLIFFRDVVNLLDLKRPKLLKDMFYLILEESGNTVNYANLSRDTGAKYETIVTYMDYLEMAFLIGRSPLFPGKKAQRRKIYKIYAGDHSFLTLSEVPFGRLLETAVFNHLSRDYRLSYWHNGGEVDIVVSKGNEAIPVEISKSSGKNPRHLLDFMEKYNLKKGYIVGMDEYEKKSFGDMEIIRIPAYCFLLLPL